MYWKATIGQGMWQAFVISCRSSPQNKTLSSEHYHNLCVNKETKA